MPSTQDHQKKQRRTHVALSDLEISANKPQNADWIVALAFYKALHAVDSYLATRKIHPHDHQDRHQHVQDFLGGIYKTYSALYRASRRARYKAFSYEGRDQDVSDMLARSAGIEQHINSLLSTP